MSKYQCIRCQKEFSSYESLRRHVSRIHKIHSTDFFVEFNLSGNWPRCKCGCNKKVLWSAGRKSFRDYCAGHQSRVNNNWGHNPKAVAASSETRRKQFASGERQVWNIGLNKETDERVKRNGEKDAEAFTDERRARYSDIMKKNRLNGTIPTLFGKDASRWQGGVSSINGIARASTHLYKEWKLPILERDGFKCTQCPNTKHLHIHHNAETFSDIIKKVMTIEDYERMDDWEYKKKVAEKVVSYHIDNHVSGVTLCQECHNKLHPSLNFV